MPPSPLRLPPRDSGSLTPPVASSSAAGKSVSQVMARLMAERERKHEAIVERALKDPNGTNEDLCLMLASAAEACRGKIEVNMKPCTHEDIFGAISKRRNDAEIRRSNGLSHVSSSCSMQLENVHQNSLSLSRLYPIPKYFLLIKWEVLKSDESFRLRGGLRYPKQGINVVEMYETGDVTGFNSSTKLVTIDGADFKIMVEGRCSNYRDLPEAVQSYFAHGFPGKWKSAARVWRTLSQL